MRLPLVFASGFDWVFHLEGFMVSGRIEWRSPFGEATQTQDLELELLTMAVLLSDGITGN